ncbi:MAG: pyrophosphatase PpaX [Acidaminococcaceae bacterium]
MLLKGILFDLDGTLVNTTDLIIKTFEETLQNVLHKEATREEIIRYFGLPLRECLAQFDAKRVDELITYYRKFNLEHHDLLIKPFPQIEVTLQQLCANGIKLAVVTSKKTPLAQRGLHCFNLEKYFTAIIGCDECQQHKPHPEPMQRGAQLLGLDPTECLCVGDSPFDLQSGKQAGCTTVAVKWTCFDWPTMLQQGNPDYVIHQMPEVLNILKK